MASGSARHVGWDKLNSMELDYLFEHRIGQDSVFGDVHPDLYNQAKERFVSELSGTNFLEIAVIISILPLSYISMNILLHFLSVDHRITFPPHILIVIEFLFLIIPTLLTFCHQTDPSSISPFQSISIISIIVLIHTVFIAFFLISWFRGSTNSTLFNSNPNEIALGANNDRKDFISFYRSTLMLFTVLSILAVDFVVFPRKYAKTETYGFSLMDVGVGSFIISMGIITGTKVSSNHHHRGISEFIKTFRSSIPLFIFGVLRVAMLWSFNYHSHVSEYGVHWNFFFTMFIVTISSFFIDQYVAFSTKMLISIGMAIIYQCFLCQVGSDYVFHQQRVSGNLFSENKEGIMSCIGFFICFHLGQWIGWLLSQRISTKGELYKVWKRMAMLLGLVVMIGFMTHLWVENASRRLCNVAYILFVMGCNLWIILLFMVPSLILYYRNDSILLRSINHNQLFVFLIGNLLTGVINLTLKTLFATPMVAYAVIVWYMAVICGIAFVLFQRNIKIKI